MAKSTLVIRNSGHTLPAAFIEALMKEYTTAFGYASPQKDASIHNEPFVGDDVDLAAALAEVEKEYKHDTVYYNFTQASEDEINYESLQPFTMVEKDGKVLLSVMLEGEFPKYHGQNEDGETYSPEYHCANTFLEPLITELWDLAGEDVELFMTMWQKKATQDKVEAELGPRATVLIIPCKGLAKGTTNNKEGATRPWGFSTRTLPYAEQKTEKPAEKKEEKPLTMKEKAALRAAQKEGANDNEKEKAPPDAGKPITPTEQYAALLKDDRFIMNGDALWCKPRAGASWKEVRTWWNTHCKMPKPLDKTGEVDAKAVYSGFPADQLQANSPLLELKIKLTGGTPKKAASEQGPAEPEKKEGDQPKKEDTPMTLFIPADQKNAYLNMKKAGKFPATDTERLKVLMAEYPSASLQLGENPGDLLMLSPEGLNRLPGHLKTCLMNEWRCQLLELEAAPAKDKEKKDDQPVVGTNNSKPTLTMKQKAELRAKKAA